MNGLERLDKFAPSQRPYALSPRSFHLDKNGHGWVLAVWAGRKSGRTTASIGSLLGKGATYDELVENIDMRYGGLSDGKWDGETLVTSAPVSPDRYKSLVSNLVTALAAFPAVPYDFDGWYYRR